MKEIEQNPFRILGLPITASAKEIERQINTLETHAAMGKTKSFETDFSFLSSVERTVDVIAEAKRKIQLDEQKFFHSLFWFWKNNSFDDLALDLLSDGKVDKAIEIWEKAVFAKNEKVFTSIVIHEDLISESDGWSNQDNEDHSLRKETGKYVIERKKETLSSVPVVSCSLAPKEQTWSIDCDAEWFDGNDGAGHGIVFGRQDGSYFAFFISANGFYSFDKYIDWKYQELIPWTKCDHIDKWELNNIRIKKIDDQFHFYINGEFVHSIQSEPLFGQYLGLGVEKNQKIVFSNLRICRLVEDDRYGRGIVVTNKNFSCVKNLSILFLNQAVEHGILKSNIFDKVVVLASKMFSCDQVQSHSKLIAGEKYAYDLEKSLTFFISALIDSLRPTLDKTYGVTSKNFIKAFDNFPNGTGNLIRNRFVGQTVVNLNRFLEEAQNGRRTTPSNGVMIGQKLIRDTGNHTDHLKNVLGDDDFEFQVIADKVADEVIQCGIDYFNATKDDEPCLPLYTYGVGLAASPRLVEKAKENLDSCQRWINTTKHFSNIYKIIERTRRERDLSPLNAISCGRSLAESTKADLAQLRKVLGENDPEYKNMADLLAREAIQCAIQFFNTTKNDEEGLPLYQFGFAVAATASTKKLAKENLDSCNEWIKTKVYRLCFFCSKNEPKIISSVDKTMYRVTNRAYRKVEFTYGDVSVPRCEECALIHEQLSSYSTKFLGMIIAAIVIGFVAGAALAPKNYEIAIGLVSSIIPGILGWVGAKRFITPVDSKGIRKINAASEYPTIQERLRQGWTFSKPSA